ncbi:MAG: hypoxanthine-guanine phosphoribosyltransferase [Gammaproteobacteria bacterium]|nr:hypoxanthine-guanine phosphoribosyltransferase [Gammaproteobacteria bacterium]
MRKPQAELDHIQATMTLLHDKKHIEKAISKVAQELNAHFKDEHPLLLCVMNGAVIFMGQLVTQLTFPLQIDYIHASRYRGTTQGQDLQWIAKPKESLKDRVVVLIEDILDSGLTLAAIVDYCKKEGAKKIYTAVMVDKDCPRDPKGIKKADFTGMHVVNKYVTGYGFDYGGYFRNLPGIYSIKT